MRLISYYGAVQRHNLTLPVVFMFVRGPFVAHHIMRSHVVATTSSAYTAASVA